MRRLAQVAVTVTLITAAALAWVARMVHRFEVRWEPAEPGHRNPEPAVEFCTASGSPVHPFLAGGAPAPSGVNVTAPRSVCPSSGSKAATPGAVHPGPELDLLQRHLLCQATRLHDPDASGSRCRDCGAVLAPGDPICWQESFRAGYAEKRLGAVA